jgi:hypothetical protein
VTSRARLSTARAYLPRCETSEAGQLGCPDPYRRRGTIDCPKPGLPRRVVARRTITGGGRHAPTVAQPVTPVRYSSSES